MPYPEFQDMIRYHSDPEKYMHPALSGDEMESVRDRMKDGLKALRKD